MNPPPWPAAGQNPRRGARRRSAADIVDILEPGGEADRDPPRQVAEHVGERMRARPAHLPEQRRQTRRAARADQPETAILGRAEHDIVPAEQAERIGDMARRRAPGCRRRSAPPGPGGQRPSARRMRTPRSPPPCGRIVDAARPQPRAMATLRSGVTARRRPPAPVARRAGAQQRRASPLEAQRRDIADVARRDGACRPRDAARAQTARDAAASAVSRRSARYGAAARRRNRATGRTGCAAAGGNSRPRR